MSIFLLKCCQIFAKVIHSVHSSIQFTAPFNLQLHCSIPPFSSQLHCSIAPFNSMLSNFCTQMCPISVQFPVHSIIHSVHSIIHAHKQDHHTHTHTISS